MINRMSIFVVIQQWFYRRRKRKQAAERLRGYQYAAVVLLQNDDHADLLLEMEASSYFHDSHFDRGIMDALLDKRRAKLTKLS